MKAKKIEKINRDEIRFAETESRIRRSHELGVLADVQGTALNLLLDKVDELVDAINKLNKLK